MAATPPIIVIGASAGGVEAVSFLASKFDRDIPAAIFVAMHFPAYSTSVLPKILQRAGKLPAIHPEDHTPIKAGHIYVAPPDRHLIVLRRAMHLVRGPRENGNRPAIDPMFRSAAIAHGARVIGVVLTGNLDDGTAGLLTIKRRGGITIAQDPADALFPSMPASAVENASVSFVLPLSAIPQKLQTLATEVSSRRDHLIMEGAMDDDALRETLYAQLNLEVVEDVDRHPGAPSEFGCPDCGGVLWEIEDGQFVRYRCRVGHAWSGDALLGSQAEQLDQALWTALRALEENASLTEILAERARKRGNELLVAKYESDAKTARDRVEVIRQALLSNTVSAPASPEEKSQKAVV
jgi:two-component system chemotaxis response regulator CheB